MLTIAVLDDYHHVARDLAPWSDLGPDANVSFFDRIEDRHDLVVALDDAEVVIVMRERTKIDRELLEALPHLRLLVTTGAANAAVDLAAVEELGITFCGTGSAGRGVSELAWGLILACAFRLVPQDRSTRAGRWQTGIADSIGGKTLGLLGLGKLGQEMLPGARAFGMDVIAWSQNLDRATAASHDVEWVNKDELLSRSDVLSIHLRLSDRTRGLIGSADLAKMRPTATLINTSRGPIVEENALVDALHRGVIGAAGLDVYDVEPLPPGHPFAALDQVVLAPHLGYATAENMAKMYGDAVEDVLAFRAGAPVRVIAAGSR